MTKNSQFTKNTQFNAWYWFAAISGILLIQYVFGTAGQIATIPYSEFQGLLQGGKVAELGISDNFIFTP
jgi:cell division protease FtsH